MSYNLCGAAQGGTINMRYPTITALTTDTNITTGSDLHYTVKGVIAPVFSAATTAAPTTDAVTGAAFVGVKANQACVLVVGLDVAGTLLMAQGPIIPHTDPAVGSAICPFPLIPDTMCPFCYITVSGISTVSGTWLPGTSNWTGVTGVTCGTPVPVAVLPATPPTSP